LKQTKTFATLDGWGNTQTAA